MDCWSCAREVPVKRLPSGKISAACPWCDFPHYANQGTEHERNLLADSTFKAAAPATSSPASSSSSTSDPAGQKTPKAAPAEAATPSTPIAIAAPRADPPAAPRSSFSSPLFPFGRIGS